MIKVTDVFNLCIQWTNVLYGVALRVLGFDLAVGITTDAIATVDIRTSPRENVLIFVQVWWLVLFIGREDGLYGGD
jgi:hypothetical protein